MLGRGEHSIRHARRGQLRHRGLLVLDAAVALGIVIALAAGLLLLLGRGRAVAHRLSDRQTAEAAAERALLDLRAGRLPDPATAEKDDEAGPVVQLSSVADAEAPVNGWAWVKADVRYRGRTTQLLGIAPADVKLPAVAPRPQTEKPR